MKTLFRFCLIFLLQRESLKNKGLRYKRYYFSAFLLFCFLHISLFAQLPKNIQKSVDKAETEMAQHKYEKALPILEKCFTKSPVHIKTFLQWKIEQCKFGIHAMQHPTNMLPINLGENVNSGWDEYHPTLTGNSKEMLFTVRRPSDEFTVCKHCKKEEDIYSSLQENGIWQPRTKLEKPLNTGNNEGAQSISHDGNYLFFTICSNDFGFGGCDIYWAKREENRWSEPKNCGP